MPTICQECGNNHFGPCATQETCFVWNPECRDIPNEVLLAGSWTKWQTLEKLSKETNQNGETYFRVSLTLLAGFYEYKYIVDGEWKYDHRSDKVDDQHGSFNNQIRVKMMTIQVFPKKKFVPILKDGCIRISSCLLI